MIDAGKVPGQVQFHVSAVREKVVGPGDSSRLVRVRNVVVQEINRDRIETGGGNYVSGKRLTHGLTGRIRYRGRRIVDSDQVPRAVEVLREVARTLQRRW